MVFSAFSVFCQAQVIGRVEVDGKIREGNRPAGGVTIQVLGEGVSKTVVSKDNGSFTFNLVLQKNYTLIFSRPGLVSKKVDFYTKVPADQEDIIFQYEFNIELFTDVAGMSSNEIMSKPVAKISYNPTYDGFVHDDNYTKQIQAEQDAARKAAEDVNKQQERARLDSLNKLWNDSLVKSKERQAQLQIQQAEQDRIRKEQEKAKKDSIDKANKDAQIAASSAAREKTRLDSLAMAEAKAKILAEALAKARLDSISKAEKELERQTALREAREKQRQDSLVKATADKNRLDSLNRIKEETIAKAKLEAEAKALEKQRLDSTVRAENALKAREKFVADSITQAKLNEERQKQLQEARLKELEKSRNDSIARVQAEAKKTEAETARLEKIKQDSIALALAAQKAREKFVADSTAKADAESQRQAALEKARLDAEAKKKELAAKDSIATAIAAGKAREKFVADSLAGVKVANDKKAAEEKLRLEEEARIKAQQRIDSISAAASKQKARETEIADSTSKAVAAAKFKAEELERERLKKQADSLALLQEQKLQKDKEAEEARRLLAQKEKAKQDSLTQASIAEKEKIEKQKLEKIAFEKNRQDSINAAQRALVEKEEAEHKAKVLAEIEEKKKLLSSTNTNPVKETPPPAKVVAAIPKIRDSDYKEGVTDETVNETNRVIYRTVVKKDGNAFNYQKIAYTWGGVFYFKNDNSITQILFEQELKNARSEMK